MRFYNPGPMSSSPGCERAKDARVRQTLAGRATSASRVCIGANGNIACVVYAKPNGNYSGPKGTGITVTLFRASAGRFALQFFTRDGSQIDGNAVATGGLANLPAALAAKGDLAPHFFIRLGDTTDQAIDAGVGSSNGTLMTIK